MTELFTPSLLWFIFGFALIILEVMIPTMIIFFFGFGAWVSSILAAYSQTTFDTQLQVFLISSLIFLALLRSKVKQLMHNVHSEAGSTLEDDLIGKQVQVIESISPTQRGTVDLNGSSWKATSSEVLESGAVAYIVGKESITLQVSRSPVSGQSAIS